MKKIAIALTLTLSTLTLPTLAQSFGDRIDPGGGSPVYGVIDSRRNNNGGGRCDCPSTTPAARVSHSFDVGQRDEPVDVFNPLSARDALATFRNTGDGELQVELYTDASSVPLFETIPAGRTQTFQVAALIDVLVKCTTPQCSAAVDITHKKLDGEDIDPFDDLQLWYMPPAITGDADVPPDAQGSCLWEEDTLWSSNTSQTMNVFVELTGNHNADVEIEYANHSFETVSLQSLNEYAGNHNFMNQDYEDIIAVRVRCEKSAIAECSNCQYSYELQILE
jgi:hypothetical protein